MKTRKVAFAVVALVASATAWAVYTPPQVESLEALRTASSVPLQVRFHGGFPVAVTMSVYRPGFANELAAARGFLAEFSPLYGLDRPEIELVHVRTDVGPADTVLVRFAQVFRHVPVLDVQLAVQLRMAGTSAFFIGTRGVLLRAATTDVRLPEPLDLDLEPAILAATAEDAARAALGLPGIEVSGETRLMIYAPGLGGGDQGPRLVWRVTIRSRQLLIDAESAQVAAIRDLADRSTGLELFDFQLDDALGGNSGLSCYWFTSTDSIGDHGGMDPGYFGDADAVTAWWAARDVYLLFHDSFDWHSYDGLDAQLETWVHANLGDDEPNAQASSWCGIEFSNGWVSRDVMGHEYGHMVIDETADFQPLQFSGALNESFSDIIGYLMDPLDWLIGEERAVGGTVRNMKNPPKVDCSNGNPCPDRWSQRFEIHVNDDFDPHDNANIINKAFYLMVDGGPFNGHPVTAMGRSKAAQLVFWTFTSLPSITSFHEARDLAIAVAQDFVQRGLHGYTSADVCTVRNAFKAVEIGRGDVDCNGVEDNPLDEDGDGILDDGDDSGSDTDHPCYPISSWFSFEGWDCDDNCTFVPNPSQKDFDGDGFGDACEVDADNDGIPNAIDPCLGGAPDFSFDANGDGTIDCLDPDDDNDGILDDGDGSGQIGDHPCPSEVTTNCDDNCKYDWNPAQYDGDDNGSGDACDPDWDGDDLYVLDDNCTFVGNAGQEDTDGDGIGDACDLCPNTPDSVNAYSPAYPELGLDPVPYQPDSDADGIPDACDPFAFGQFGALHQGSPYSWLNAIEPDSVPRTIQVSGPAGAGGRVRLALPVCETPSALQSNQLVELLFNGLPATLGGWVEDDSGRPVGRIRSHNVLPNRRGLRFRPRCDRTYAVTLLTGTGFPGSALFSVRASILISAGENPWASNAAQFATPPYPLPDQDGDGFHDGIDNCPAVFDPNGEDGDEDQVGDVCDNCPAVANPSQGPVGFVPVHAIDAQTFAWPGDHDYNWVSGPLDGLHSGNPFAALGPRGTGSGSTFSLAAADPFCTASSCWFLWKYAPGGCGSWGSVERDAAIPTFCVGYDDCSPGESCIDGECVTPLGVAACP